MHAGVQPVVDIPVGISGHGGVNEVCESCPVDIRRLEVPVIIRDRWIRGTGGDVRSGLEIGRYPELVLTKETVAAQQRQREDYHNDVFHIGLLPMMTHD